MATVTSKLHVVKNAIVDGLNLRAGLIGPPKVQVASAYLGKDSASESIQLAHGDDLNQKWSQLGNLEREESLTIGGLVWVMKPGADESIIRAARARVFALTAEIEDFLRADPSIGNLVKSAQFVPVHLDEGANPDGRVAQLDFQIVTMGRLRSS